MSKKSRIKHQQKKKNAKKIATMSRRQAQMSLELEAARAQMNKTVPMIDMLVNDVRNFSRHILVMENRLKRTIAHIETGAYIDTPIMTRDEYILALQTELKKITQYKSTVLNPLMKKMVDTVEIKDGADRLLGEAEMQVALDEAMTIFTELGGDVFENIGKLNLQESLKIDSKPLELETTSKSEQTVSDNEEPQSDESDGTTTLTDN